MEKREQSVHTSVNAARMSACATKNTIKNTKNTKNTNETIPSKATPTL